MRIHSTSKILRKTSKISCPSSRPKMLEIGSRRSTKINFQRNNNNISKLRNKSWSISIFCATLLLRRFVFMLTTEICSMLPISRWFSTKNWPQTQSLDSSLSLEGLWNPITKCYNSYNSTTRRQSWQNLPISGTLAMLRSNTNQRSNTRRTRNCSTV